MVLLRGLPNNMLQNVRENLPRRHPPSPADVFAYVKRFVSDSEYSQRPLVTWPGNILAEAMDGLEKLAGQTGQGTPIKIFLLSQLGLMLIPIFLL